MPAPTLRVAARLEYPAYVVLRPGPMAMASEPSAMASAANPAASRASLPRCIRTSRHRLILACSRTVGASVLATVHTGDSHDVPSDADS